MGENFERDSFCTENFDFVWMKKTSGELQETSLKLFEVF
jgi:hypothetical protein